MITFRGRTFKRPLACCGFCDTPVFILHDYAHPAEKTFESILKSKAIPPQPDPYPEQEPRCATCGKRWHSWNFYWKEGEDVGTDKAIHQSRD